MLDMKSVTGKLFAPVTAFVSSVASKFFAAVIMLAALFVLGFFLINRINPFRLTPSSLRAANVKWKYFDLFRWLLVDFLERDLHKDDFKEYGFTFYVGRQGAGKTASMVRYLEMMKARYPKCVIVTNFGYAHADHYMENWRDLMTIRNGTDGVIFAIDEIHSEYSSASWKDVPESLLSEISQQRKQRVKIVATAQFFTRVAKPLREQAFSVVACKTYLSRFTCFKEYDALEYADSVDNPAMKKRLRSLSRTSFVQTDAFRQCYDTYEKIRRMEKAEFIPRNERGE